MTTTNFATARDVTTALSSLGFQPSVETIQTISRNCREQFLNHLSKCITGQDAEGNSKKVIGSLLRCLSPDALNRLNQITPNVTADRIVPVALKAPTKLLSAIEAASNPEHERHIDAKSFLTSVFSPVDQEEAAQADAASNESAPQQSPLNAPSQSRRSAYRRFCTTQPQPATTGRPRCRRQEISLLSCLRFRLCAVLQRNRMGWQARRDGRCGRVDRPEIV